MHIRNIKYNRQGKFKVKVETPVTSHQFTSSRKKKINRTGRSLFHKNGLIRLGRSEGKARV